MKRFLTSLAAVALLASPAYAQDGFDVQSFKLAPALSANYLNLQQARALRAGQYELGLMFNYANDPLVFHDADGDRAGKLVQNLLTAHVLAAVGIGDRLEIGIDVPFILMQDSDVEGTGLFDGGSGFGMGDIRFVPKLLLFGPPHGRDSGPAMALSVDTYIPTGDEDALQGGGFRVEPRLAYDWVFRGGARFGANLGYFIRPNAEFANVEMDDALTWGVAADLPFGARDHWHIVPEIRGETVLGIDDKDSEESPMEAMLGFKVFPVDSLMIAFGGGTGLVNGVGTPDFRLFGGLSFVRPIDDEEPMPEPAAVRDDCPDQDEDVDGFQDDDGCPDPDNDGDGVLDVDDACPDLAEDIDGFEDEDGCIDFDNDGDLVIDRDDQCPMDPEDVDGFEDADGCPDPDNDGDSILDADDNCPDAPEDFDGELDEDGCPDTTEVTCEEIRFEGAVNFGTDSDVIERSSYALLDEIAAVLDAHPEVILVEVGGHTDSRGSSEYNRDLSQRRTEAVVRYLENAGVDGDRLTARGYGEDQPIDSNDTEDGMARNRRVEITILERTDDCE